MHLSKSRFMDFKKCPRSFHFKEHLSKVDDHIRELADKESEHLIRHEFLRNAVGEFVRTGELDINKIIYEFRREMNEKGYPEFITVPQAQIIESSLEMFTNSWSSLRRDYSVVYVHQKNPVEFEYNKTTFMAMPEVVLRKEGHLRILSFKSGKSGYQDVLDYTMKSMSLIFWARSALEHFGETDVEDIYLREGCSSYSKRISDLELREHHVIGEGIRRYYAKHSMVSHYPPNPSNKSCKFCNFKEICDYGGPEHWNRYEYNWEKFILPVPSTSQKTFFLSHASEDKEKYVRPVARMLEKEGISFWLDESEIGWGDSVIDKLSHGLKTSEYLVCFLSEDFSKKAWTKAEVKALIMAEMKKPNQKILPILIGDDAVENLYEDFPLLRDKSFLNFNAGIDTLKTEFKRKEKELFNRARETSASASA